MPAELGSMSLGSSMQHEAAIKVAMPDRASVTDYKFSLDKGRCQYQSGTALISDCSGGIRRNDVNFSDVPPEMLQNP